MHHVVAEEVLVDGSIKGTLLAKTVGLASRAVVIGDVSYCDLIVERNATLEATVRRIAERARGFVEQAKPLEALHLLDVALTASPDSKICREVKRAALQLLNKQTGGKNLWERMSIAAELRTLDE